MRVNLCRGYVLMAGKLRGFLNRVPAQQRESYGSMARAVSGQARGYKPGGGKCPLDNQAYGVGSQPAALVVIAVGSEKRLPGLRSLSAR